MASGAAAPTIIDEMIHQDDEPATPSSEAATSVPDSSSLVGLDPSGAVGIWVRLVTLNEDVYEGLIYAYDTVLGVMVLQALSSEPSASPEPGKPSQSASETSPTPAAAPKSNGRPLSFAAAAAAAASRSSSSSPPPPKKPSSSASSAYTSSAMANGSSIQNGALKFDFHVVKLNHIKEVEPLARLGDDELDGENGRKGKQSKVPQPLPLLVPVGQVPLDKLVAREHAAVARIGVGVPAEAQDIFDNLSKTLPTTWRKRSIIVMDEIEIVPPYTSGDCRVIAGKGHAESALARVKKVLEGVRTRLGLEVGK
ncbi:uncharacterized protein SPPG_00184 [Spizellomyces punctatus DAOM BR117]|uniref:AD domain-containing protein n=1 Tax=Spizellomyces punctatus (strain DAOM BR117) TaxID=645134 RepID=A0A0L0HU72_SPIPD|nr:uncharacterized protein SPPG_00184 [Spizellomyces punctatus DAOM BR117]KND04455.1 hypothetical protein SPPG_00184 [Spizellomyces punctatus DAOM BR117]|eukprot:XP_016612494.1 hypothetical protein SPPG_00184 [Spizellomyces punctatus DAOM BR117]